MKINGIVLIPLVISAEFRWLCVSVTFNSRHDAHISWHFIIFEGEKAAGTSFLALLLLSRWQVSEVFHDDRITTKYVAARTHCCPAVCLAL